MNYKKIRDLSSYIITEYYKNNIKPYFDYMDENVIWYGPAEKHKIISKKDMLEAWGKEAHELTFTLGDIKSQIVAISKHACSIILSYNVWTHYPNGTSHIHNQHIDLTWVEKSEKTEENKIAKKPYIIKIIISNTQKMHEQDNIYAVHSEFENTKQIGVTLAKRILIKGLNGVVHQVLANHIAWIEKANEGRHSIVHTLTEDIFCLEKTAHFHNLCRDFFLSPHKSYLINPLHVKKLERFKLTLNNNHTIPVAEKKYTKFKNELKTWTARYNIMAHNPSAEQA